MTTISPNAPYQRWNVYWADYEFGDRTGRSKERPVIVLNQEGNKIRVLYTTSQDKNGHPWFYYIRFWQRAGLSMQTHVQINETKRIAESNMLRFLGNLLPVDQANIQNMMKLFLAAKIFADPQVPKQIDKR